MHLFRLAKRAWPALVALAVCAVYFYGLGGAPLVGPDEPRYAQVAREMWERGDFVTPTLGGHTWFEKPALLYWLMMAAYTAFGVSEYAARAASAVAGLLTVLFVGWAAGRAERASGETLRHLGVACAAVAATALGLVVFSRGASFDIILTAALTAALCCFLVAELEEDGKAKRRLLAGFYAGVGAALLAKGLVGAVIPAGVLALYFLLRRELPRPLRLGIVWGPLLALAVAAVWYAPVTARHGWGFVDEFFIQHHFARYVSNKYRHPERFYFFVPVVFIMALPWTFFLASALWGVRRWDWRGAGAAGRLRVLALAWAVFPVAFFSLSVSKLPGYVLPALPGALLLAGERVARYLRGDGEVLTMRLTGALLLAWAAGVNVYTASTEVVPAGCALAVAAPTAVAGVFVLGWTRMRAQSVAAVVAASLLTVVLSVGCALEHFARRDSVRDMLSVADARGGGALPVLMLHDTERTAEFYAPGRVVYDSDGEPHVFQGPREIAEAARARGGRAVVLVPSQYARQLTEHPELDAHVNADDGRVACVTVQTR